MGVLFSCPADDYDPLDMEEAPPAGVSGGGGGAVLKALGSGKLLIEGSLSFKRAQAASGALHVETEISIWAGGEPEPEPAGPLPKEVARARFAEPAAVESPKHEAAAIRLQKVNESCCTRRQLADCAVLIEQSWWKLLDFALLKRSSVSFFDIEKQETAGSREMASAGVARDGVSGGRARRRSSMVERGGARGRRRRAALDSPRPDLLQLEIQVGGRVSCGRMRRRRVAELDGRGCARGGANRGRRPPNRAPVGHIGVELRGSRSTAAESSSGRAHQRLAALDLTASVAGGALRPAEGASGSARGSGEERLRSVARGGNRQPPSRGSSLQHPRETGPQGGIWVPL